MASSGKKYQKKSSIDKANEYSKITPDELLKKLKLIKEDSAISDSNTSLSQIFKKHGLNSELLFFGTQSLRIKRTISWFKENFATPRSSRIAVYFGQEFSTQSSIRPLQESLTNFSLFEKIEIIVIQEADKIKSNSAKIILPVLNSSNSNSILILCAEELKGELLENLRHRCICVEFSDLPLNLMQRWIEREVAQTKGPSGIEPEAISLLARTYSGNLEALSKIIEHLSLLTPVGENITAKLASELFSRATEVQSFDLMRELSKKNIASSQKILSSLLDQGFHPLQLNAFLSRATRTLLATSASQDSLNIASELKHPWFKNQLQSSRNCFKLEELVSALKEITYLDFKLKDSKLPEKVNTSISLLRIASRSFIT